MIVEQRTYTVHVGKAREYLEIYEQHGLEIQESILGHLFGYFRTEIGPLEQVIHMWAYDDFNDRAQRRIRLLSDERWQAYIPRIRPLIVSTESQILIPAPFSPPAVSRLKQQAETP